MKKHPHHHHVGERLYHLQMFFYRLTFILELAVAVIVIIGIGIELTKLPGILSFANDGGSLNYFLRNMFNIIIGIELIKMLSRHDLDSVVEVLLFAVARYIIIEHLDIKDTFIGVATIAVLFVIRKYLFISALDKDEDEIDERDDRRDDIDYDDEDRYED